MRYSCHFLHEASDERRTIIAALTLAECLSVDSLRKHKGATTADTVAAAYALRHAYAELPKGFLHVSPPELIMGA
ncbi:hypothetical protein [Bradyrhizobium neotropicale]|uniref:Uncharacterized protein n=1 Tax=Bradyrhizobium neotropicale TaxID=1497615 RepID=A0A176ZCD5_9BRAD|nr:hypothetical protein [Bradyrhizobium neotropicale]OAF17854.1 hypothetical protein AXW67_06960 [Bradyrhizobium neotropicale]